MPCRYSMIFAFEVSEYLFLILKVGGQRISLSKFPAQTGDLSNSKKNLNTNYSLFTNTDTEICVNLLIF